MRIHWSNGTQNGRFLVKSYPGGEPLITGFQQPHRIGRVLLRPTSMLDFMAGMFFLDALAERSFDPPDLILPFVPGARQDRLNSEGDFLFTAKSVAKEINARRLPSVTIFDPHSDVIAALIDRCNVVHAYECYANIGPDSYGAVVSPDAGAEKRAMAVAKQLGVPLLHGWKSRDVRTGAITGFGLEPTSPTLGRVLVVDDICDGGGTFMGLSGVLAERLLKHDLYVTHGIFSQGTKGLLSRFGTIMCTDSIDIAREGVRVIPVCKNYVGGDLT